MGLLSLLFGFKGRINRAQFWLGNLGAGFGIVFFVMMMVVVGGMPSPAMNKDQQVAQFVATFAMALLPALLLGSWCGLALQWKRFHDRGRNGVWVFLPALPSFMMMSSVFGAITTGADPVVVAGAAQPWATILWLINLGFFVDLGLMPGKEGPNKYGDPPGGARSRTPGAPAKGAEQPIPGMTSGLTGVQSAMDRAIAERAKHERAQAAAPRAAAAPGGGLRPASSGSFGRKVTQ